jgi:3-hydroxy-3-methylglutaryl CoA synthase
VSGLVSAAASIPYRRLDRAEIRPVAGSGGGKGRRAVASFDEDPSTLAFEAGRAALAAAGAGAPAPDLLLVATTDPPYVDKTNATVVHAALRLDEGCGAWDAGASVRSAVGALRLALERPGTTLVAAGDLRGGLPGGGDESAGGDAGAAVLVSGDEGAPFVASYLGGTTVAAEFLDRWRPPGAPAARSWEERFGELQYVDAGVRAWKALDLAGLGVDRVDHLVVAGTHARACSAVARKLAAEVGAVVGDLADGVGNPGAAQPLLLLTSALETAGPGQVVALLVLADGADVLLFRTTDRVAAGRSARTVAAQVDTAGHVAYGRYLAWRGMLQPQPPNRPEPARVSAPAAQRNEDWKLGLVSSDAGALAGARGRVATFTVDRLVYSLSPPVVFAVVDFPDTGARLPLELTDVDEDEAAIGMEVEMVFRRLGTSDGIHNYFWKARPVRDGGA